MIAHVQSERIDDEYHMQRGIAYLEHRLLGDKDLVLNDPPAGQGITVLPLWLAGGWKSGGLTKSAIWGHKYSGVSILLVIGIWKSLLFLPVVVLAFVWM